MKLGVALATMLAGLTLAFLALRPGRHVAAPAPTTGAVSAAAGIPSAPHYVVLSPPQAAAVAALAPPSSSEEEAAFMSDLRALAEMDAELSIERAREGAVRFGASADAPERRSILIHALSRVGRASEARGEAESMVNECPDSTWVREVERFSGAHRHRNIRLATNGQLEYW